MAKFLNAVMFNPTTGGTTDFTVSAAVQGYQTPNAAGALNGVVYRYRAESSALNEWEIGYGAYNTGTGVLTRTAIIANSLGTTAKINFAAAPNVSMGLPLASDIFAAISTVAPTDPADGALWWKSDTGVLYVWDGSAWQPTSPANVYGQCTLLKSGANIVLLPNDGNLLTVNGAVCTIPDAGVALAATGLTPGTTYFIYAVATARVVTSLEASTTVPAISTAAGQKGLKVKTGDDTRTLVGIARPITGPAWQDVAAQRFVRSYWNRKRIAVTGALDTVSTETSSGYVEKTVSKAEFVCFADDQVLAGAYGMLTNSTQPYLGMCLFFDGVLVGPGLDWNITSAGNRTSMTPSWPTTPAADGYHYVSFGIRQVGGGTTTLALYTGMQATAMVG